MAPTCKIPHPTTMNSAFLMNLNPVLINLQGHEAQFWSPVAPPLSFAWQRQAAPGILMNFEVVKHGKTMKPCKSASFNRSFRFNSQGFNMLLPHLAIKHGWEITCKYVVFSIAMIHYRRVIRACFWYLDTQNCESDAINWGWLLYPISIDFR